MNQKCYLGDGLYAQHDGYQFYLSTMRENVEHFVALEPEVLQAFMEFVEITLGLKIKVEKIAKSAAPEDEL